MNADRLDALLDEALVTGQIASDVTAEERAEIQRVLQGAGVARTLQAAVDAEARASQPTARARFQRHMAAETAKAAPVSRPVVVASPRKGLLAGLLAWDRGFALAGSLGAIALLVVVATVVSQSFGGVEIASALVLNDNDYAQVQGMVSDTGGEGANRTVTVQSDFGEIRVALSDTTALGGQAGGPAPALKRGDSVTVAGTVSKREKVTAIAAVTLSIASEARPTPDAPKIRELRKAPTALEGTISVFTVSGDGRAARVLVNPGAGEHLMVRIGPASLGSLLALDTSPVGLRVRVTHDATNAPGEFTLTVISPLPAAPQAGATRAPLTPVRGTLISRQLNIMRVMTDRGEIAVVFRPETRVVIGPGAGLTVGAIREGTAAAGHEVSIQGYIDRANGRLVAEVLWVGGVAK